eukprot:c20346_g1_i2 orf=703-1863(-)
MKAHVCASRLLRLLPEVVSKKTNGQLSFLSSRALLGCRRKGAMTGLLLPGYPPSRNLSTFPAPLQACGTHKSSCLIPTLSATVKCSGDMADGLVEALMSFGASSVSIENGASSETDKEDNQNGPVAWSNEKRQFWNQCELIALFPPGQNVEECLASAFDSIGLKEALPYELSEVKHQNWEQQVKELFQPLEISDGLWIIPQWSIPPDPSATLIILDPGLAFGTGDHPTTQLCIRWLKHAVKGGEHILDYGTGSGILAITGLKLGAAHAVGVDIDPMAVSSATYNASLNGYGSDSLQLFIAPSSEDEQIPDIDAEYDLVVANLLLNPLLLLSKHLVGYTKPGGRLGLSGILESQVDQIREAYGSQLENIEVQIQDGWACLSGTKVVT